LVLGYIVTLATIWFPRNSTPFDVEFIGMIEITQQGDQPGT
jgi:hypothetical protein